MIEAARAVLARQPARLRRPALAARDRRRQVVLRRHAAALRPDPLRAVEPVGERRVQPVQRRVLRRSSSAASPPTASSPSGCTSTRSNDALVLSVLAAVHQHFGDYEIFVVGSRDMLIVATQRAPRWRRADWSVFALPAVAADLARFVPLTRETLESTRFLGRAELAPLFDARRAGELRLLPDPRRRCRAGPLPERHRRRLRRPQPRPLRGHRGADAPAPAGDRDARRR